MRDDVLQAFKEKLGKDGVITVSISHKETINIGNFESISPSVHMSFYCSDSAESPDELRKQMQSIVEEMYSEEATRMLRNVINRRGEIKEEADTLEHAINLASYYKKLS